MCIWVLLLFVAVAIDGKKACPGGTFSCPDKATCCHTLDDSYGCCPLQDAVCCEDRTHCCPFGHKCSTGMCVQRSNTSTVPTLVVNDDVTCPDGNVTCPEDATCCKNPYSGSYSCCPMADAVCCNDGSHCCPSGTTCNLKEQKCDGDGYITKLYGSHKKYRKPKSSWKKMAFIKKGGRGVGNVICPGSEFECPDANTCCKLPSGDWGCCPFPNGFCCKDRVHCCPENMHCDETSQYCSQDMVDNITSLHIKSAKRIEYNFCPDSHVCEDFQTCCLKSDTVYGCCSLHDQHAVCCSDRLRCCPSGTHCWAYGCWKFGAAPFNASKIDI